MAGVKLPDIPLESSPAMQNLLHEMKTQIETLTALVKPREVTEDFINGLTGELYVQHDTVTGDTFIIFRNGAHDYKWLVDTVI